MFKFSKISSLRKFFQVLENFNFAKLCPGFRNLCSSSRKYQVCEILSKFSKISGLRKIVQVFENCPILKICSFAIKFSKAIGRETFFENFNKEDLENFCQVFSIILCKISRKYELIENYQYFSKLYNLESYPKSKCFF